MLNSVWRGWGINRNKTDNMMKPPDEKRWNPGSSKSEYVLIKQTQENNSMVGIIQL